MSNEKKATPLERDTELQKGKYVIERTLGSGGYGITYRARKYDGNVKQYYAIKEFFMPSLCERQGKRMVCSNPVKDEVEAGLKCFISEAKRLNKDHISHPNIVAINEWFEENDTAYFVMEYIMGRDVRAHLSQKAEPLSENEAKQLIKPLLQAVAYLHDNSITHLDIKPDNILLEEDIDQKDDVTPKLIDFGLAVHYNSKGNATTDLKFLGCSPGYAPMEQYRGAA